MPWNRIAEGVTFYTSSTTHFHTYTDWGLIMESDNVTFPPVSGVVDGWESLYGNSYTDFRKKYGRRKLVFDFGKANVDSRWPALVSTITGAIHGKKCRVIRDCENTVYYIGRCNVTSYVTHLGIGKIRIEVQYPRQAHAQETNHRSVACPFIRNKHRGKHFSVKLRVIPLVLSVDECAARVKIECRRLNGVLVCLPIERVDVAVEIESNVRLACVLRKTTFAPNSTQRVDSTLFCHVIKSPVVLVSRQFVFQRAMIVGKPDVHVIPCEHFLRIVLKRLPLRAYFPERVSYSAGQFISES